LQKVNLKCVDPDMQPTETAALNDQQHGYNPIINVYLIHTMDLVCMQQSLRACIVNNCLSTWFLWSVR